MRRRPPRGLVALSVVATFLAGAVPAAAAPPSAPGTSSSGEGPEAPAGAGPGAPCTPPPSTGDTSSPDPCADTAPPAEALAPPAPPWLDEGTDDDDGTADADPPGTQEPDGTQDPPDTTTEPDGTQDPDGTREPDGTEGTSGSTDEGTMASPLNEPAPTDSTADPDASAPDGSPTGAIDPRDPDARGRVPGADPLDAPTDLTGPHEGATADAKDAEVERAADGSVPPPVRTSAAGRADVLGVRLVDPPPASTTPRPGVRRVGTRLPTLAAQLAQDTGEPGQEASEDSRLPLVLAVIAVVLLLAMRLRASRRGVRRPPAPNRDA